MSLITTLNASDLITNSRAVINTNFSNLNTDKIETSVLDTDTALTANSDSKIATQKAVKAYVDASINPTGRSWNEYAVDAVGTDAYGITISGFTTYTAGQTFKFKAATANTGACSLNINAVGAKTIKKDVSSDLTTGDILANQIVVVVYDGTNFQLVSPPATTSGGDYQVFTSNGTWIKPSLDSTANVLVEVWAGGGGGGGVGTGDNGGGGGGGGGYSSFLGKLSDFSSSIAVVVGSGGVGGAAGDNDGSPGGSSSFGGFVMAYGGGGGEGVTGASDGRGGGGGGLTSVGTVGSAAPVGGGPGGGVANSASTDAYGGGGGSDGWNNPGGAGIMFGGGGGGSGRNGTSSNSTAGGSSIKGGGGGSGGGTTGTTIGAGGVSLAGGDGGAGGLSANGATGTIPAGGGGGAGGASRAGGDGARGEVRVTVY